MLGAGGPRLSPRADLAAARTPPLRGSAWILTQDLPLLQPIRDIPFIGPPIADIFQPNLRVLVDLGYSSYGPGLSYADIPTSCRVVIGTESVHRHPLSGTSGSFRPF
ncbi:PE family protein PE3 [Mycobacterium pseudokansasii]|uniref:PE family protein PE3 n=1 Tax=Mycobacterium pseudokansasii TaxID=2341080 RepID=A0A498QRK6_9MYCO|nr:PE family protein PE3 [Mycobacterium pseudokansasii]